MARGEKNRKIRGSSSNIKDCEHCWQYENGCNGEACPDHNPQPEEDEEEE